MSKKIRIAALVLACISILFCLPGCSKNKKAVATCGEYEIPYEFIRFATLNFKLELEDTFGDGNDSNGTIWDDPETAAQYKPLLEEKVWGLVRDNYAVLAACEAYGIGIDVFEGDKVTKAVDTQMNALMNSYDTYLEYEQALEESYMTADVFRFLFAIEEMKTQLYNAMKKEKAFMTDEETFYNWLLDDNYAYIQHVMRKVSDGDESEAEMAFINDMYEGLTSGAHDIAFYIDSIMNEDTTNVSPYFIVRHAYDNALVDAALNLKKPGDVSDIIQVDNSYYILVRMEEADGALAENLTTLLSTYQWGIVGEKVEEIKASMKIEKTKYGEELDLLTIE